MIDMIEWQVRRQDGYNAYLGVLFGEVVVYAIRHEGWHYQLYFWDTPLEKSRIGGVTWNETVRDLKDAAQSHFEKEVAPILLRALRTTSPDKE